jgi:protein TonB
MRRLTVFALKLLGPSVTTRTFGESSMLLDRLRARLPGAVRAASVASAALWPVASAMAQAAAPVAAAASAAPAELTPAERAKRDGDKVFHWILIHGDRPRKPVATVAPNKPAASVARVKPAARAPNHVDEPAVETASSASAAPVATAPQAGLTPAPAAPASTPELATPRATSANLASAALTAPLAPAAAAPVEDDAPETLTPLSQAEPKFPISVVRALRSGQVRVKFTVQPDGSVADPTVIGSSSVRLNPSALAAVAQWRFAPVRKPQHGVVELGFKDAE